ncbi:hypothetical protein CDN99_19975 [Roseateles aquatilis]|uniref:Peptidase C13 family protein n=1 Tax=Roseateles aquatilis TaxID=431061 RepID=A0A246J310_9BURK|nr:C13 family peptidase [Roseateles aquatilis]OWQ86978.1 hypothetical protein CDN99_19975 [Roseateles aquatilis]
MNESDPTQAPEPESAAEPASSPEPMTDESSVRRLDAWDWLREAARVMTFRAPRWRRLDAGPLALATLMLLALLLGCGIQRLAFDIPVGFSWMGLLEGWASTVLSVWLGWVVVRSMRGDGPTAPGLGTLVGVQIVASVLISLVAAMLLQLLRETVGPLDQWPEALRWAIWLVPMLWGTAAGIVLLWRLAGTGLARLLVVLLVPGALVVGNWPQPAVFWRPILSAATEDGATPEHGLHLTEDVLTAQPQLIADALNALPRSAPGRVNVYAVTFAPYATQDVFMHESEVVAKTMAERFDAGERTVQLVMNPATGMSLPWATHANLRRTIERMAAVMDRDRDVLFLHLTSHGGKDAKLAADAWPVRTEPLTPQLLKQWLDEAGVRWRVISISACYSGSWIEPLADDGTLVMTAADADHTSYGCGARSPLTFFGQAMYVDALKDTWSFQQAHAQARKLIEVREREAGKTDGYSNPQLREGVAIGRVLARLEAQQRGR